MRELAKIGTRGLVAGGVEVEVVAHHNGKMIVMTIMDGYYHSEGYGPENFYPCLRDLHRCGECCRK